MLFFYGIRHYGKGNLSTRYGVCDACGTPGHLTSYDTARFLHLYWIPLIPTGHVKVIDQCPHCNQCRTGSPRKLAKQKQSDIDGLFARLNENPNDSQLVQECFGILSTYNEQELFVKMAKTYGDKWAHDGDIHLSIAYGYYRMGHFSEAAESAKTAQAQGAGKDADDLIQTALSFEQNRRSDLNTPSRKSGIPLLIPYLVPLLMVCVLLGGQLFKGIHASIARDVWLVNGTLTAYSVELDGKTYTLPPHATECITLPMGNHHARILDSMEPDSTLEFNNRVPFLQRMTDHSAQILNPDGMAFFIKTAAPFIAENSNRTADPTYSYFSGQKWLMLGHIDFLFRDIPEQIEMPSRQTVAYKTQLSLYKPESYVETFNTISQCISPETAQSFAEQTLRIHPENKDAFWMLQVSAGTNGMGSIDFLETGLAQRPVLIEWHRFYQSMKEIEDPGYDLASEYSALAKTEPKSSALKYLLGRVIEGDKASAAMFLEAEKSEDSQGYGYHAIAYNRLCRCDFKNASKFAQLAMNKSPGHLNFENTLTECRYAGNDYGSLLKEVRKSRQKRPDDGLLAGLEIRYLCLMGKPKESQKTEAAFFAENQWIDATQKQHWVDFFASVRCYVGKDIKGYLNAMETFSPESAKYERSLHEGNPKQAYDILKEEDNNDYSAYLIIYCAAMRHNQPDTAERAMQSILDLLKDSPETATLLAPGNTTTLQDLHDFDAWPDFKRIMACALAFQHPDRKEEFLQLARTCNYKPFFPHHLVEDWIDPK
jgi:hypothetical protein